MSEEKHFQSYKKYVSEGKIGDSGLHCHTYDIYQKIGSFTTSPYGYGVIGFLGINEGKKARVIIEILD